MTSPSDVPIEQRVNVISTPETELGVYADFVGVWHQPHSFVLDFSVHTQPPQVLIDAESGQRYAELRTRLAARIRIPPSQVFEIMKALEQQLSAWEMETGQRQRPDVG